jgi:hypothetical protein
MEKYRDFTDGFCRRLSRDHERRGKRAAGGDFGQKGFFGLSPIRAASHPSFGPLKFDSCFPRHVKWPWPVKSIPYSNRTPISQGSFLFQIPAFPFNDFRSYSHL